MVKKSPLQGDEMKAWPHWMAWLYVRSMEGCGLGMRESTLGSYLGDSQVWVSFGKCRWRCGLMPGGGPSTPEWGWVKRSHCALTDAECGLGASVRCRFFALPLWRCFCAAAVNCFLILHLIFPHWQNIRTYRIRKC